MSNDAGKVLRMCLLVSAHFIIFALVYIVWQTDIGEFAQGVVTLVLGRFLGYLDQMYAFEYGTTRSNKVKDATIASLAAGTTPVEEVRVVPSVAPKNEER